jgi:hypothetical protein
MERRSLSFASAIFLAATLLAACAPPYRPQPLPPGHPASPESAEAPMPPPSRALAPEPASRPGGTRGAIKGDDAGGGGESSHHGGH